LLPGEPRPATVRLIQSDGTAATWQPAFVLPEIAALRIPASVVLHSGSFRLDRRIELMLDQRMQALTLYRILDHGNEFERCVIRAPD